MRWLAIALLVCACSSSSEPPRGDDAGADAPASSCPPPLGTAAPRGSKRSPHPLDDVLRVNHLQAEATHNSYHLQPDAKTPAWQYSHAPLAVQLQTQGVRGVELDVRFSTECGRYEVYHLPLLDERTTCRLFTDCLAALRGWSDAHAGHHLLFVQIEPKDALDPDVAESRLVALEREILSVFPRESIVAPDEVKGDSPTIAEALATRGWPTLGATRGRVLFYLDRSDALRDVYTHGRKDLAGRLMFADAGEGDPFAAVRVLNDPIGQRAAIAAALKKNQLVRVFAEKSLESAKSGDRAQLEAALASGAQIVSTDLPAKTPGTDYFVEMPGGTPSRCNPVTAPSECTSAAIESPERL